MRVKRRRSREGFLSEKMSYCILSLPLHDHRCGKPTLDATCHQTSCSRSQESCDRRTADAQRCTAWVVPGQQSTDGGDAQATTLPLIVFVFQCCFAALLPTVVKLTQHCAPSSSFYSSPPSSSSSVFFSPPPPPPPPSVFCSFTASFFFILFSKRWQVLNKEKADSRNRLFLFLHLLVLLLLSLLRRAEQREAIYKAVAISPFFLFFSFFFSFLLLLLFLSALTIVKRKKKKERKGNDSQGRLLVLVVLLHCSTACSVKEVLGWEQLNERKGDSQKTSPFTIHSQKAKADCPAFLLLVLSIQHATECRCFDSLA